MRNLVGFTSGRLTVLEITTKKYGSNYVWLCICSCGNTKEVASDKLTRNITKSCGCLNKERLRSLKGKKNPNYKHGRYNTKEYNKERCAFRRAVKLRAIPKWADIVKIRRIYKDCPRGMEVDHIIPLISSLVCGLHVENNLQYLAPPENRRKSNTYLTGLET